MSIEAMKQALEALENEDLACRYCDEPTPEHIAKAITAIREVLEQPKSNDNGGKTGWPPGLLQDDHSGLSRWLASKPDARQKVREALADHIGDANKMVEQPEQEPVAQNKRLARELDGVIADVETGDGFDDLCLHTVKYVRDFLNTTPPPRKPWVGLTDEERGQVYASWRFNGSNSSNLELCRAIEDKLRDKNT